ncbi:MAG: response regulator [Candidatus Tectomicrobia bacterium]|uniref:histidine kinase n=1 Tax=Tectimicrobiota bacterium TaxID=2528274 RepID=A0A932CL58_UNCTE|nr:response regulator [Candidatus Tectomicrobia bacterium]
MWSHEASIGQRLALSFGVSCLMILLLLGIFFYGQQRQEAAFRRLAGEVLPKVDAARDVETAYLHQATATRGYVYSGDEYYLKEYNQALVLAQEAMARLDRLPLLPEKRALFQQIQGLAAQYREKTDRAMVLRQQGNVAEAHRLILYETLPLRNQLLEKTRAFVVLQFRQRDEARAEVDRVRREVIWTSAALSLLALLCGALISLRASRSVTRPVQALAQASRALARGDFEPALRLAAPVGDWREAQVSRNELRVLTAVFGAMAREISRREGRLSAQARLASVLASGLDTERIASEALREIAEHARCDLGLVYVHDPEAHLLRCVGTYALEGAPESLRVGEGIPGEAAASRRRVLVQGIPADTPFHVRLGFDQVPPRTVVAVPMVYQNQLVGSMLLGSLRDLPEDVLGFIETAAQQVGVSLQSALAHQRIQKLAEELQEKSELLAVQNEEFRVQAEELQERNEQLQAQSEELQAQSEELLAQQQELEEADRRKDEFLAMLSHELRNPLGAISNVVEVLRRRGSTDPVCDQMHAILDRQVTHMARLLNDLLEVSRVTQSKIALRQEPVDLATAVSRAVETARPLLETRGHDLQVSLPAQPVRLEADPMRLEQILVNLLDNAAKYTEPGGQISLTAEREGEQAPGSEPALDLIQGPGQAVLRVRDTGVGIPPELLPHVFDLFTQGDRAPDRAQGGLGIGLTLVKRLVEMHGGSVAAYSDGPGKGSELVVWLPALPANPAAQASDAHSVSSPEAQGSPQRVLIVDDNVDGARMLAMILEMWGHQVWMAHDGPAAIEAAKAYQPGIVLLDIGLPGMDGYEVAQRLRQQKDLSPMRLVALTGYGHEEDRARSREVGFDEHLVKPVPPEQLQQVMASISRGR